MKQVHYNHYSELLKTCYYMRGLVVGLSSTINDSDMRDRIETAINGIMHDVYAIEETVDSDEDK